MTRAGSRKAIITCAVTGAVHTPTMSPALPVTPAEIAAAGIEAHAAGAAVIHLHARDPETGRPTPDPAVFMQFLPEIRANCDAVINITTGGSVTMSLDDRLAAPLATKPELCSLNLGSMNFNFSQMAENYSTWKYDWEESFVRGSDDIIFKNTFRDIESILVDLGEAHGTRFEFECYDVGHLYTLAHFVERGLVRPPFFLQLIFGVRGGIGADTAHLTHMKATADRLFGDDYVFSVFAAGRHQIPFCTTSATMGGHVRVGLEDSLYIGRRQLAKSNAEQVEKICAILVELGIEIATPDEAREILQLKGASAVGF
ncbi:3-keto-5-aminohexanoate cleavage protein [Actinomycetospora sp. NBRC 106375]|uniref:3-keto-5-aminohexanoate cleavage protein n=1 Tax=Actinomycetospora sp. NBRC 106375 TaxID=3032207 RepID=UPI0024A28B68|nr:3-keto-5-aminohexanoate cleavage protein [Actinomycetospora sp. NBRC 106375]GLZ50238.1 3-keto-5-aminohexanoate cleavage protein [Actinomycetospora sp. NBRC 106375]